MQSDAAVIKCAQCGAQLIVRTVRTTVDEYRVRHIWKCEPCGYAFEATIAKATLPPQKRKSVTTDYMSAKGQKVDHSIN